MEASDAGNASGILRPNEGRSVWLLGGCYTFKVISQQTGGAYSLTEVKCVQDSGPPPHVHLAEDEVFYVLEGGLEFLCDGRWVHAGAGSVVRTPKGTLHTYR